ncbi:hypothetical protein PPTG_21311 [Phytophthora nicotianae INRA-310]|uniref:Uncharacterized protein n=1 Tax=Phytophthora nicotianae (strain INRA-310) TaxID=761204 RepID=W2R5G5_PHYN3|nr:hypothetical protein PPTG_21311 [Phytophthora nicotianae INRA-310]ETN20491.1 hypothetical protein PPTG_21311 [Phytophthora nicotianae INRA-310]
MEATADPDEASDVALLNAVEALIGAAASSTSKRRKHYTFKQKREILRATEGMSEREAARTQEEGGHHQENHPSTESQSDISPTGLIPSLVLILGPSAAAREYKTSVTRATASRPMKKNVDGQMQAGVILQSHVGSRGIRNSLCESYVAHPKELSDVTTFIVDAPANLVSCYSGTYILGVYARSDSPMIFDRDVSRALTELQPDYDDFKCKHTSFVQYHMQLVRELRHHSFEHLGHDFPTLSSGTPFEYSISKASARSQTTSPAGCGDAQLTLRTGFLYQCAGGGVVISALIGDSTVFGWKIRFSG